MNAQRPVLIFISAASDLMPDREALARMIAALPVTLAWRVVQTPISEADLFDPEALQSADLYLLIMGGDIRAPVGLEWLMARQTGRPALTYLKRGVLRTPAGQVFINQAGVAWRPFADAADLSRQVQRGVAEHLVQHALQYALTPDELAALEALPAPDAAGQTKHGEEAGHSAIILSRERFEPSQGVIVGHSNDSDRD